jgi:hypothetical protein
MSEHRSFPKPAPRLHDRVKARYERALAWRVCCAIVDVRENYHCRVCGRRTHSTLTLCPKRAEHHHLAGRRLLPKVLLNDSRLVILVCLACHGKLTRHELLTTAEHEFKVDGRSYPDADGPLTFI